MSTRNHHIAIKTCRNFRNEHYAHLLHSCDKVLKDYSSMSIEIVMGSDIKANRWARKYANATRRRIKEFDTPLELLKYSDAIILYGKDPLLMKLEEMAHKLGNQVIKFPIF